MVGRSDGASDGSFVGAPVGPIDGPKDGISDIEGNRDGAIDGGDKGTGWASVEFALLVSLPDAVVVSFWLEIEVVDVSTLRSLELELGASVGNRVATIVAFANV